VITASDFHFLFEKGKLGVFRIVLERTEMEPNEGALAKQTKRNEIEGNRHRWAKNERFKISLTQTTTTTKPRNF
jgi:hypothetical protein